MRPEERESRVKRARRGGRMRRVGGERGGRSERGKGRRGDGGVVRGGLVEEEEGAGLEGVGCLEGEGSSESESEDRRSAASFSFASLGLLGESTGDISVGTGA